MTKLSARRPSRRARRRGALLSVVGALVVAAALVWQSAYAGFADTTPAVTATIGTGTIAVSNNVEGYGALTLPEMRPGDANTQCLVVTSTGSEPAQIKLYGKGRTSTPSALTQYITFAWQAGTGGGANGDCTGFVSNGVTVTTSMASFPTTFGSGFLAWNTAGGAAAETRTYRLSYSFANNPPASTKGGSAAITFVWEAQQR